jgi:hypothetical protein
MMFHRASQDILAPHGYGGHTCVLNATVLPQAPEPEATPRTAVGRPAATGELERTMREDRVL